MSQERVKETKPHEITKEIKSQFLLEDKIVFLNCPMFDDKTVLCLVIKLPVFYDKTVLCLIRLSCV